MSKVEALSRQYVLPFLDKVYEKYSEHKQMELSKFDGYDMMSAYEEGYHQAEKDNELTWKDIEAIDQIFTDVFKDGFDVISNNYYQEVLRRFKDLKHVK